MCHRLSELVISLNITPKPVNKALLIGLMSEILNYLIHSTKSYSNVILIQISLLILHKLQRHLIIWNTVLLYNYFSNLFNVSWKSMVYLSFLKFGDRISWTKFLNVDLNMKIKIVSFISHFYIMLSDHN